jgi:hypothetical protein
MLSAAFCAGLLALAVLPPLGVAVPRWLILAYGAGCALLALLAVRLSGPWQQRQPALQPHRRQRHVGRPPGRALGAVEGR